MTDLTQPLDLDDPGAEPFLAGLQGNIIKGHGRPFTAHVLLAMTGAPAAVRDWIRAFARDHVTSAADARVHAAAYRATGESNPFAMFLLAPEGYRYLGFTDAQLPGDDAARPLFAKGLKGQGEFNDPPSTAWAAPYQRAVHATVLLADDDRGRLQGRVTDVCASLDGVFEELVVEHGQEMTGTFGDRQGVIEHFGFRDGISNPLMVRQDIDKEVAERGGDAWNPRAPLSLALVTEPGATDAYGSFMVFRKLEQNVRRFWETLETAAAQSGTPAEDLGAMAVGRHRDGTPTVPVPVHPGVDGNDFAFGANDEKGELCPFHAHIRKTNPRGDLGQLGGMPPERERSFRIVRRGITYDDRPGTASEERPEHGVGLLFMCFQSSLQQFAIQQGGSDDNRFPFPPDNPHPLVGVDAVIGQNPAPVPQTWPSTGTTTFTMANLVTMLGGEYFFAPSLAFLGGAMEPPAGGTP